LEDLTISMDQKWGGGCNGLIGDLRNCLEKNTSLKNVFLSGEMLDDDMCLQLIPFLLVNKTLTDLTLGARNYRQHRYYHLLGTTAVQLMSNLEMNESLIFLRVHTNCRLVDGGGMEHCVSAMIGALKKNTTLCFLCIVIPLGPTETFPVLPEDQITAAMLHNYGVGHLRICQESAFLVPSNRSEEASPSKPFDQKAWGGVLGMILRLNKAGRGYFIHDPASREKGVEVLIQVSDDLDCLFYHLRENPLLCDLGRRV
jgi:hypothetical protein